MIPSSVSILKLSNAVSFAVIIISFYLILFNNPYTYDYSFRKISYLPHILIGTTVTLLNARIILGFQKSFKITKIDLAAYILLFSVLASRFNIVNNEPFFNEITINFIIVLCFFFIIRQISAGIPTQLWIWLLLPGLLIQIYFVFGEYLKNYNDNFSYLLLTGTLGNSGLCAAFIVITSPIILQLVRANFILKYLSIIIFCTLLIILKSRASFLAFLPIAFFYTKSDYQPSISRIFGNKYYKIILILLALSLSTFLFLYKKDSAIGRIFIWKLSVTNSSSFSFFGIGYGEFPEAYKKWQISYFQSGNRSLSEAQLVDLPPTAFNEPLQILIEQGLIGLLAFLLLLIVVCFDNKPEIKSASNIAFKMCLLAGAVFSLFSYPYHSFPILAVTFIFLGLTTSTIVYESENKSTIKFLFILPLFLSLCNSCFFINKRKAIKNIGTKTTHSKIQTAKFEIAGPYLYNNGGFLMDYALMLYEQGNFQKCIETLKIAERQSPKIDINILMGKAYSSMGKIDLAEKQFLFSMYALPNRLTPKYHLFTLYLNRSDTLKAIEMGDKIVNFPVKVNSIEGFRIQYLTKEKLIQLSKKE